MKQSSYLPAALLVFTLAAALPAGAGSPLQQVRDPGAKVIRIPMRSSGPGSLDPAMCSTVYDKLVCSSLYETLLQYSYLERPYRLEPLLLAEMPTTEDGLTWRFRLKSGVRFHDDPCFPDGRGREMVTEDVFYSLKRLADRRTLPSAMYCTPSSRAIAAGGMLVSRYAKLECRAITNNSS